MYTATQGMVRVYSGVDASVLWEWRAVDHTRDGLTQFGARLGAGQDINGDGYDDVLVASPKDAPSGNYPLGSVTVFSGRTGELLWRIFSPELSYVTQWLALYGDLNDDGLADFGKGNPDAEPHGAGSGRITVYAGARGDVDRLCPARPDSVGPGARLETSGPIGIGNNGLTLTASGAVPGQFAFFLYGPERPPASLGDARLCLGPPVFRLPGLVKVQLDGSAAKTLDFTEPHLRSGPGRISPGAATVFQLCYRDPDGPGGSGFHLSDALRIRFLP
jgi:hypothetical protein